MTPHRRTVLVTGATGYVGGRLIPQLLAAGHRVRALVRSPEKLAPLDWADRIEIAKGSLDDFDTVRGACEGVDAVYYLVHSMSDSRDFAEREKSMAETTARAVEEAGVRRIIYLGGLHPDDVELSVHMRSRAAVGEVFLDSTVPAAVFEAGIIIGSGSASFEMIRHLAAVLPAMPAPSWVTNRIEPLFIRDLLHYLVAALDLPEDINERLPLGCGEVMTYAEAMSRASTELGLPRRPVVALPLPAQLLAGYWVSLVTPLPHGLAVPLVQSLQDDAVRSSHHVDQLIDPPPDGPTGYSRAIAQVLEAENRLLPDTAIPLPDGSPLAATPTPTPRTTHGPSPTDPPWAGPTVFHSQRTRVVQADQGELRQAAEAIVTGLKRWSLEKREPTRRLLTRRRGERFGSAWLDIRLGDGNPSGPSDVPRDSHFPDNPDGLRDSDAPTEERASRAATRLTQTTVFAPRGLLGVIAWHASSPVRALNSARMISRVLRSGTPRGRVQLTRRPSAVPAGRSTRPDRRPVPAP
ncbi:NAD(P)H-binding protein [Brevibacterium daeguense]|uniref:NAD(P)H-binding protein n=1 Tax=Brevibacterium daeguense TaxID=909936 RepID=A0ABP8EFC7_9MICO